jgi:hypothetical protein
MWLENVSMLPVTRGYSKAAGTIPGAGIENWHKTGER